MSKQSSGETETDASAAAYAIEAFNKTENLKGNGILPGVRILSS